MSASKKMSKEKRAKLYRIGEVAKLTGVQQFVLRFWEREFAIKLPKAPSGHRFYRHEDVQKILTIKRLLYAEGFTIKGAIQKLHWGDAELSQQAPTALSPREANYRKTLQHAKSEVVLLLEELN